MSNYISISSPFTKAIYTSTFGQGRLEGHPLYLTGFNESVPVPFRRLNTVIQNNTESDITVGFSNVNPVYAGGPGIVLGPKQILSLDNYNGLIYVLGLGDYNLVTITESFA